MLCWYPVGCSAGSLTLCMAAQRVQNLRLWKAYIAKRADMIEDLGGKQN